MVLTTIWRKSPFTRKKYIFLLEKGFFSVFSFHFHFLIENEKKSKKYINFSWQIIFFSQLCINYPVSSVSLRINSLSKKDHLYFSSENRNICNFTKKVSFHRKGNFWMIFCLFHCFHQTIKKQWILPQYTFVLKKIINDMFFNVFRSINGILNKTAFYKYNICNFKKRRKFFLKSDYFKVFFNIFICWCKKYKKIHS